MTPSEALDHAWKRGNFNNENENGYAPLGDGMFVHFSSVNGLGNKVYTVRVLRGNVEVDRGTVDLSKKNHWLHKR